MIVATLYLTSLHCNECTDGADASVEFQVASLMPLTTE